MSEMEDDVAAKLRKRALVSAARRGFHDQAEDLAQEVMLHFLEGRGKHQTVDQAVTDAIRKAFGDPRILGHQGKKNLDHLYQPMDVLEDHPSRVVKRESIHDFDKFIEPLGTLDRAVMCLKYIWGFRECEIAHCLGVSESSLGHRKANAQRTLLGSLAVQELVSVQRVKE